MRPLSANSRRAVNSSCRKWEAHARDQGHASWPADTGRFCKFLRECAAQGIRITTLKTYAWAIGIRHREQGHAPLDAEQIQDALWLIARRYGTEVRQVRPLDRDALAAIRSTATRPRHKARGGMAESEATATRRGTEDIALATLMSDAGLRVAEVVALTWNDVTDTTFGGQLRIARSKGDQAGQATYVGLTHDCMRALGEWAQMNPRRRPLDRIFPMSPHTVRNRIKAMTRHAGLGDGFSGHSGRVGYAVRMVQARAPQAVIMNQGRWQSPRMVAHYSRSVASAEAVKYLEDG